MSVFPTEKRGVEWFQRFCRDRGSFVQKFNPFYTVGFPDLLVVHEGVAAFYEAKKWHGSPERSLQRVTEIQWSTLGRLARAGAYAYAVVLESPERCWIQSPHARSVTGTVTAVKPTNPLLWLAQRVVDPPCPP